MKKLIKNILTAGLFALLLFTFQTCKKDKICSLECDRCENFPPKEGFGISVIKQMPFQKHAPCFNPKNGDEFIYIKKENNKYQLIKYNLQSKSEMILLDNAKIIGQPKWGKNGWIVFADRNFQVNILKENGSMLQKITSSYAYLYPDWLSDTSIVVEFSFNLGVPYYYCELSKNGEIVDTLRNYTFTNGAVNSIKEKAYLSFSDDPNISLKLINNQITTLTNLSITGRNSIEGIYWHPNNEDVFYSTYRDGLFKINKNTKTVTKIKCGCDSRSYRNLSISPDGSKIIVERVDATDYQNKTGSWTEEGKIIIMDIDGSNEKNIFE